MHQPPKPTLTLLSMPEAAARIGCSRPFVYDLIAAGKLRRFDIGLKRSKTRVADIDVQAYIESTERPVTARDTAA